MRIGWTESFKTLLFPKFSASILWIIGTMMSCQIREILLTGHSMMCFVYMYIFVCLVWCFFFDFGMPWAVRFLLICLIIPMISLTHFLSLFSSLYFVESTFLDFFLHVTDNGRIARKNQYEAWILNTNETSDRGNKK